ncbi:MAG: DsbA family oxidoreductase [Candidatus Binatus sp.]|uniref:DsbA family oxidoreductase n=1 Tax=Candidatus Binatus sp. TaxID=2811406 RepID=UPI00271AC487|nr:DsbA family oxidoreductase [Candidatus Binatus sp.]MDO8434275.1 DsbA family oxidoreductase [Candidatus Binatus sp.]
MAFRLRMFSDFICPFCYIGFETVRKLRPEFGFELELRGFQIHPEWPAEGLPLSKHPRMMDPQARRVIWTHIQELAEAAGVTMKAPEVLANSRLALEAAEFARENGKGGAFDERVFRAYFSEGLNIGMQAVLGDLATDVGLDRSELDRALESRRYAEKLNRDTRLAHQLGVSGVPAFFLGEYSFTGAQSEEMMREIMRRYVTRTGAAK